MQKIVVNRYRYNGILTTNLNWWGISEPSTVGFGLGCKKVAEKSENWNQSITVKTYEGTVYCELRWANMYLMSRFQWREILEFCL